jgi:ribonucleoside-diphosphate reductase alpha chain
MAKEGSTISGLMDSFATAASLCLQHGVPLKVLCEKFAHTRFEPSGWTGDEQIGYAKSLMDYLFRWMQLRFLSGHQLSLFNLKSLSAATEVGGLSFPALSERVGSAPAQLSGDAAVPLAGAVTAPGNTVLPHEADRATAYEPTGRTLDPLRAHEAHGSEAETLNDRRAPQQGIAPDRQPQAPQAQMAKDLAARAGLPPSSLISTGALSDPERAKRVEGESMGEVERPAFGLPDRGVYHAATAMKSMYNMGDAPSCSTCGSIMTRNGSCYRCMECGSTSGCS